MTSSLDRTFWVLSNLGLTEKKSIHESLNQMTIMCHAQHHHFKIVFDIRLLFRLFS